MQDFNRALLHPVMATIRAVSAGDQLLNPSSRGGSLSCPSKGGSCVTSWGRIGRARGGGLGHGGVFVFFLMLQVFFCERKKGEAGKIRLDLKNSNESWSL